jgi:four helix bundle protein
MDVWKLSMDLVTNVYELTTKYPMEERYGLAQQMRRAAVSIPSNIAEGAARKSPKEFIQFLHISLGSLSELETQLEISKRLGFIREDSISAINNLNRIRQMLQGLIRFKQT